MKKVTLWHVHEEVVGSQVDVVDDLAKVCVEVSIGQVLEVVKRILRNVSLPLQLA